MACCAQRVAENTQTSQQHRSVPQNDEAALNTCG